MLVHDIRKNRSQVIDFREVAPLGIPLEGDLQKDTKVRSPPSGTELAGVPSCPLPTAQWKMPREVAGDLFHHGTSMPCRHGEPVGNAPSSLECLECAGLGEQGALLG